MPAPILSFLLLTLLTTQANASTPYQSREQNGAILYPAIAYAKPPVKNLRWKRPQIETKARQAPEPISCPQVLTDTLPNNEMKMQEDCLYLNIWSPKPNPANANKSPVILFIHGGALLTGSGLKNFYDGSVFARAGVVFVAINYRLGDLGYGPKLETEKGSLGLLDQATALDWVAKNIHQFGGDPNKIYLMGQSKGAEAAAMLLETGLAGDNAKGAITLSGPRHSGPFTNHQLPKLQSEFYPGEQTAPWQELLKHRGLKLYLPELPSLRLSGSQGPRYRLLVTTLYNERLEQMYCYVIEFLLNAYDYIDPYFYVLHPGTYDHGSELLSLFQQDPYGQRLLQHLVHFVENNEPPEIPHFGKPKLFRETKQVVHLYPRFTLPVAYPYESEEQHACRNKESFTPNLGLKFRALETLMKPFGGLATTPDFDPNRLLRRKLTGWQAVDEVVCGWTGLGKFCAGGQP